MNVIERIDGDAIAPLTGNPHVTAIREIEIDGACGPWSTPATSAASSSLARSAVGRSPRSISQTICGNVSSPMSSSIGYPLIPIEPG